MSLIAIGFSTVVSFLGVFSWVKRTNNDFEQHSVSASELQGLMGSDTELVVLDVRQPLDLLAYPEQIPGAQRVPPDDVLKSPNIIPKDKDVVFYCTCPSDKTSRMVLGRALTLGFSRVKLLRGGLAGWKEMGLPVEPFRGTVTFPSAATPTA